jgi:hypothetical protein
MARAAPHGYIHQMRCSVVSRITALALATLVSFSAPGLALAHGHAHHEADERAARAHGHAHDVHEAAVPVEHGPDGRALAMGADEPDDHAHPQLALALAFRIDALLFVLPSVAAAEHAGADGDSSVSLLLTAAAARAGPSDAPPRQPRAPPLG